jgi:hypothetical protein
MRSSPAVTVSRFVLILASWCLAGLSPVRSQPAPAALFDDPTVWVAANSGVLVWTPGPYSPSTDYFAHGFSLHAASPSWAVHAGYLESEPFRLDLSGWSLDLYSRTEPLATASATPVYGEPEVGPYETLTYRALHAVAGPQWQGRGLYGAMAAGPALSWGTRARNEDYPCLSDCPYLGFTRYTRPEDGYLSAGLAGRIEGGVRLIGRVWLGGETTVFLGKTGTHAATGVTFRVDLLRPDQPQR